LFFGTLPFKSLKLTLDASKRIKETQTFSEESVNQGVKNGRTSEQKGARLSRLFFAIARKY
jgi:hypothetical protein